TTVSEAAMPRSTPRTQIVRGGGASSGPRPQSAASSVSVRSSREGGTIAITRSRNKRKTGAGALPGPPPSILRGRRLFRTGILPRNGPGQPLGGRRGLAQRRLDAPAVGLDLRAVGVGRHDD